MVGTVKQFMEKLGRSQGTVHDPFAHAQMLLKNEEEISFEKKYYNKIVGAKAMLSNISSDQMLSLIQNDISILTAAYELAYREPAFRQAFEYMFNSWNGGLSMTRALGSMERSLQATPGGGYSAPNSFPGLGEDIQDDQYQQEPGLLDRLPRLPQIKSKKPDYRV